MDAPPDPGRAALAQQWLDRRFAGLSVGDFEEDVRIYCTSSFVVPPGFEQIWATFTSTWPGDQPLLSAEESAAAHAILIIADVTQEDQVDVLRHLTLAVDALGHDAPPILWVPHTVAPEARPPSGPKRQLAPSPLVTDMLELGIDGIVPGEPHGYQLALAVRAFIHKSALFTKTMSDLVNERRSRSQYAEYLKDCTHCILWDYLRIRLAPSIPPVDYDIPPGEVAQLDGYTFSQRLGRGTFGTVYKLEHPSGTLGGGEVMKVVDKSGIVDFQEIRCMKRMIDVMRLLNTDNWRHQNIVQLHEIYHSPTHLFFRMEYGGPENLYRRLSARQKEGELCRPISAPHACTIIIEAITAVAHLHTGPKVCHRDIKPENLIVLEEGGVITVKLADFDLALIQESEESTCRSPCGTMPFTAPEVLLDREYNGQLADIWSLGIVIFEVHCGVRIVERVLDLKAEDLNAPAELAEAPARGNGWPSIGVEKRIRAGFEQVGSAGDMLAEHCLAELQPLIPVTRPLLNGMLRVTLPQRWRAARVAEAANQLNSLPPPE